MKKSLVALAVLASCGAAMAQSSVTLYGIFDVGIEKLPGISTRVSNNVESKGRIGFRGVEDLGGGLQASFVLETGFSGDKGGFSSNSGAATIGNRASWLSIGSKDLGKFSLGRGYVGAYYVQVKADPTGSSYGQGQVGAESLYANVNNTRFDNVIRYETPNLWGFSADLGMGLRGDNSINAAGVSVGETRPVVDAGGATGSATRNISTARRTGYTLGLQYNNGPIYVGAGVVRADRPAAGGNPAGKLWVYNGTYDFGMVKLYANVELDDRYTKNKFAGHVGLSAPLGAGTLMAYYGQDNNGGVTLGDKLKNGTIAYSYNLSKRTDVYGALVDDNVGGAGKVALNGNRDGLSTQVGIRHKF